MSVGDVLNPKRVRLQANERLDQIDADALSSETRDFLDAHARAVDAVPRNVGSSTPVGLIFQGFGLTLNPTGPTDAKVRVQSALGVAFDANGRLLIKEADVQSDLTLSAGNSQIYVYFSESSSDTAVRRGISTTSPFVEAGQSMATKFKGDVGFFTRTGNQTSIVASDVVNGVTTALCFLGVANNSGGTVTMSGYDATTAPNGAFATNRLSAVTAPTSPPPTNTASGSVTTLQGMVNAALYAIGQFGWKGSRNTLPSAANNFQAFAPPTGPGLDALFDSAAEGTVSPITTYRDWNLKRRSLVDHNGYRMGQVTELNESWLVPATRTWRYDVIASQRAAGGGGGFAAASVIGEISINAAGQLFHIDLPSKVLGGFSILSGTVRLNRSNGTDSAQWNLTGVSPIYPLQTIQFSTDSSTSGTGDFTSNITTTTAGSGVDFFVSKGSALFLVIFALGTPSGTIKISQVSLDVVVDPPGWEFTPDLGASFVPVVSRTFEGPTVALNQPSFKLRTISVSSGDSGLGVMRTEAYECFLNADVCYVQEWMVRTGTITAAANNRSFALGVQNNNGGAGDRFVYFFNQNTTVNWQIRVVGSSTTDTNTGVAIAANTTYRMRLEINGANVSTAGGSAFRIRGYINGTKVVDVVDATLPAADMIRPYFHAGITSATAALYSFNVGRVRRVWNHLLDGDNL